MSTIEWTGQTWNPTTGCDRVSPGCDNCYALTLAARLKAMGQAKYQNDGDPRTSGPGFGLTVHPDTLGLPLRRRKPTTYFVDSMSDLFHPDVPDEFLARVFGAMGAAERHTFQVLTKRPQRMAALMAQAHVHGRHGFGRDAHHYWWSHWFAALGTHKYQVAARRRMWADDRAGMPLGSQDLPWPPPNVWLGTSIESDRYTFRADHLRATPASVRFLSLEPLLGPLPSLDLTGVSWVIVGAESGRGARPMDEGWVRDIRDRSVAAGIPFFYKQKATDAGRKVSLPQLDGRTWDEMPEVNR